MNRPQMNSPQMNSPQTENTMHIETDQTHKIDITAVTN
jgi:hypothetical protein